MNKNIIYMDPHNDSQEDIHSNEDSTHAQFFLYKGAPSGMR